MNSDKIKSTWKIIKEFNDEETDTNVRVTLSDKGDYSYHIGRLVENNQQSRHLGIFYNKKTRQIIKSRVSAITNLVMQAHDWIQEQLNLLK